MIIIFLLKGVDQEDWQGESEDHLAVADETADITGRVERMNSSVTCTDRKEEEERSVSHVVDGEKNIKQGEFNSRW